MHKIYFYLYLIYLKWKLKLHDSIFLSGVKVNSLSRPESYIKIYKNTDVRSTSIGHGTYIGWNAVLSNVCIGRFCSIAPHCEVIYGKHPTTSFVSSHPSFYSVKKQAGFSFVDENLFSENNFVGNTTKSVVIGHDVWLGHGVKILEGITIGHGAIVGANSLVTKDISPYSINVGSPSREVRKRFDETTINALLRLEWWDQSFNWVRDNSNLFDSTIDLIVELERIRELHLLESKSNNYLIG